MIFIQHVYCELMYLYWSEPQRRFVGNNNGSMSIIYEYKIERYEFFYYIYCFKIHLKIMRDTWGVVAGLAYILILVCLSVLVLSTKAHINCICFAACLLSHSLLFISLFAVIRSAKYMPTAFIHQFRNEEEKKQFFFL